MALGWVDWSRRLFAGSSQRQTHIPLEWPWLCLKNRIVHIPPERLARELRRVERILFSNIQTQLAAAIEKTLVKALETQAALIDRFAMPESQDVPIKQLLQFRVGPQ